MELQNIFEDLKTKIGKPRLYELTNEEKEEIERLKKEIADKEFEEEEEMKRIKEQKEREDNEKKLEEWVKYYFLALSRKLKNPFYYHFEDKTSYGTKEERIIRN